MKSRNKAVLLLGTNLGDRDENLKKAQSYVNDLVGEITFKSKIEETKPVGFTAEMDFYNQIIYVETDFSPIFLLRELKNIEKKMGRIYSLPKLGEQYVSRIIDLDILYFNGINYNSGVLKIPHPQVLDRKFVRDMLSSLLSFGDGGI